MTLSKSQFVRGAKCHKSLWLYKNRPELIEKQDSLRGEIEGRIKAWLTN